MSLIEKIEASIKNGEIFRKSTEIESKKTDMEAFRPIISSALSHYERAYEISSALQKRKINFEPLSSVGSSLAADIDKQVLNGRFSVEQARTLDKEAKRVEEQLTAEWNNYIEDKTGAAREIVNSIKSVVENTEDYKNLKTAENRLRVAKPGSDSGFQAIDNYLVYYNKLMNKMKLNDNLMEFLKKLSSKGEVSLKEMNPECLQQLQKMEFAGRMKVVIK